MRIQNYTYIVQPMRHVAKINQIYYHEGTQSSGKCTAAVTGCVGHVMNTRTLNYAAIFIQ